MTNERQVFFSMLCSIALLAACSDGSSPGDAMEDAPHKVDTSGKEQAALTSLPDEVLAAVTAVRPQLKISEAEHEVRDGRDYYDVGGVMPDGSELELDMTQVDGVWTVVEFQRDIEFGVAPSPVQAALGESNPGWTPTRIIESDQGDGTVIYEYFGAGNNGEQMKVEVKWQDGEAEVLRDEWQH